MLVVGVAKSLRPKQIGDCLSRGYSMQLTTLSLCSTMSRIVVDEDTQLILSSPSVFNLALPVYLLALS